MMFGMPTQIDLIDNKLIHKSNDSSRDALVVNSGKNFNKNKSCAYYHVKGHIKSECLKLKEREK